MHKGPWAGARKGLTWLAIVLLAGMLAACEEDTTDTETTTQGDGTIDSPYILDYGASGTFGVPTNGSVFFAVQGVAAEFATIETTSTADVDLVVFGFGSIFGTENANGSFTADSGDESYMAVGDGSSTLFFMVDGQKVTSSTASVTVSTGPADAIPSVSVSLADANTGNCMGFAPPNISCDQNGTTNVSEVDLGFVVAPSASLSASIDGLTANAALFRIKDCDQSGCFVQFVENGAAGYGPGYCHRELGGITSPGTCTINPVSGYDPPVIVRIVNNAAVAQDLTVTFSTP